MAWPAWSFFWRKANGWIGESGDEIAEVEQLARRAVELGSDDVVALAGGGYALVFVVRDLDAGAAAIDRALALNPNHALEKLRVRVDSTDASWATPIRRSSI